MLKKKGKIKKKINGLISKCLTIGKNKFILGMTSMKMVQTKRMIMKNKISLLGLLMKAIMMKTLKRRRKAK